MRALFKSLLLTIIHEVFSILILTYFHFSQIGKPVPDSIIELKRYNEIGALLIETGITWLQGHICYWDGVSRMGFLI